MNMILHPLARFMVSLIFIMSGVGKIFNFSATSEVMAQIGFPFPELFLTGAIILELIGGFFLLFGYLTKVGTILLIVFLIPATIIFHVPFVAADQMELTHVLKNLAILGALLLFFVQGAGAFSVDGQAE